MAFISTHHGNVPNLAHAQFAEGRTIHAIAEDGELSAILVDHAVAENDILILQGHVTYDLQPAAAFSVHTLAVDAGGALDFRTDIETRLAVTNLIIFEGGTVTVGTEAGPIGTGVSSEIVIADSPINVNVDPEQFGHGILVFGTLQMHGAPLTNTIAKLAQDAHAGDSTIHLQQAMTDWHPGDILFLPDTRQATSSDVDASGRMRVGQWEEVTVAGISQDGRTITTSAAIAYDHVGARNPVTGQQEDFDHDGYFDLMPHAANETRNVVVQSANPIGTRGHFVAFNRSEVDLRYVQFDELGRTTVSPIDSTTLDASGNVTHIGTNQIGRYALHFHHVQGVANPASGYTVQVVGCTVTDTKRWGIVLHDTSWSNVSQNVVLRADGAGIVTEDGSDAFNTISRNFVGVSTGDGNTQDSISFLPGVVGFHGYGLWLSGVQDSVIEGNIMVNHAVAGMNINFQAGSGGPLVSVPRFPGADVTVATDAVPYYTGAQMPRSIANNEFYGAMTFGFESWTVTGGPTNLTYATDARVLSEPFLISDSRAWHLHGAVSRGGYAGNHSIDGLVARNQFNATVLADYQRNQSVYAAVGVRVSRTNSVLRNFDIQGFSVGVLTAQFGDFQNVSKALFVDNGRLVNYIDALVSDVTLSDRDEIIFNDVIFDALPGYPLISFMWGDTPENRLRGASQNSFHLRSTFGELYIQNYNRVPQQDYKLYREGQNPFYVHRLSDGDFTAQSLWDYRRFAVRGELSPCLDAACSNGVHSHPEILADVFAAGDSLASINVGPVDGTYYAGYRSTFPYFTARYTLRDSNGDRYNVTRQLPVSPGLNTAVLTETATDQGELSQPVTIYVDGDAPVAALEVTDITTTQARLHVTANEPVVLQVTAPAVLGTYVYSLEGDLRLTNLVPNTTYTVTMRVTDRSGNAAVPVATFTTASVDVPQLVIESPLPNATVDAPVSVVYHVTGDTSNVRRISWRLGTLSANETVLDGQHQFPVVPSGTYTLSASIVDAAGVVIPASQISFPLAVLNTDTARPVIANILTTDVDADSVRISWTTDEPATTRLTVDGRTVVNNTSLTTDHVATVDNLVRGQRMAANVQSADSAANLTERFIYFAAGASEPALQPPVISDVHIVATASNAVLTWRTDRPADTRIDLGSYPAVRTLIRSQGLSVSHRVDVVGLVPDTAYHLNVSSSTITGFASENIHIFTPAAPGVIDLSELVAISNFGGDIRGNTANLIRQRLVPAAADAAIRTVTVPHVTQRALRSSRSRSVMDRAITASSLPTTGLRGQAAWPLTSRGRR